MSYQSKWPDGSSSHPAPIIIGSANQLGVGPISAPTVGIYNRGYESIEFATTESTASTFYPFFSTSGSGQKCRLNFGNDIPGSTTNDFAKAGQYTRQLMSNPCLPDLSWLVGVVP